jgi:hypothetical protein
MSNTAKGKMDDIEARLIALEADMGTIVNTGGVASLGAILGDAWGDSIIVRLAQIQADITAIKAKTDLLP